MAIVTAHAGADCFESVKSNWLGSGHAPTLFIIDGKDGMLPAYQKGYEISEGFDVLAFIHDDLYIHDEFWYEKVLGQFQDTEVALCGFGGALGLGDPNIYKVPYDYHQLARQNFYSNMRDAESHGQRFAGARDVATLDGFALIVRREFLTMIGGWPLNTSIGYVNYDNWLSCMVRRHGKKTRLVGCAVDHLGGRTFVQLGIGRDEKYWKQYLDSHAYLYENFRDILPFAV